MKLNKKIAVGMAALATIASIGTTTALANNSGDTNWAIYQWTGTSLESSILTEVRAKTDDTSAYGYVKSGNTGASYVTMQLKNSSGGDLVGGTDGGKILPAIGFSGNVANKIPNYAYENGYRSVRMKITQQADADSRGCNGVWSPDSI